MNTAVEPVSPISSSGDSHCVTLHAMEQAPAPERVRVALVDDEEMVRRGLEAWLAQAGDDVRVVIATPRWDDLLGHAEFPVDVVLLDYQLHDGVPAPRKVEQLLQFDVPCIIVSTVATAPEVRACISAGARGYLPKSQSPQEIIRAVQRVASGSDYMTPELASLLMVAGGVVPRLSPQELRAFTLYAGGLPMKSVAKRLEVSYDTAKDYVDRVRDKYENAGRSARTKVELYQRAIEDGYVGH